MNKLKLISTIILLLSAYLLKSQDNNPFGFECSIPGNPPDPASSSLIGGYYKPECIDCYTNNSSAYFPVLIVYVQFTDDPGPEVAHWPSTNNGPTFKGTVIATEKASGYGNNWWNAYDQNDATLSDYWMEVSRGKLHLVGKEVSVVLPHDVDWYEENGNLPQAMEDLFTALQNNEEINWPTYDKWSKEGGTFVYGNGDGYVDFMYIVARSNPCSWNSPGWGYFRPEGVFNPCTHGNEHTVYNSGGDTIKLQRSFSETGSGFQISPGGCGNEVLIGAMEKWATISFSEHEHGHYFFGSGYIGDGYHQQYSKVNNYQGMEEYLSPYELIKLGYQDPQVVDFSDNSYPIDDWTSRYDNEMLKVPIGSANRNEFFLIANRQKESSYDRIMWGDTAHDNPYRYFEGEAVNYGKGVYIYHAYPGQFGQGYPWGIHINQECADGLWNWDQNGSYHPDWSCIQLLPFFEKSSANYNVNDNGGETIECQGSLYYHDGKSLGIGACAKWYSIGKTVDCESYADGTDRVWANETEVWTSREWKGDRWDAWKVGYNEVFSPYSSPSTYDWSNQNSDIFIYLESQNGTEAYFKIYKVGEGGWTEDDILEATPPSKPMLYRPVEIVNCNGTYGYPKIIWENNLEPDMLRNNEYKRYKIYRAQSNDMNTLPDPYSYLATYDDYTPNDTVSYIDFQTIISCGWTNVNERYYRYEVVAVDMYDDESVKSDFAAIQGASSMGGDNYGNNSVPILFSLSQNYPNPFNPVTQINYSIPANTFVTIKVYNIIGELVTTLVNYEYKLKGYYAVKFDGTNIASGVYFYSITAGAYFDTKKMVLVK